MWITFKSCIFAFWNNDKVAQDITARLWITFKSCIFAFWNNKNTIIRCSGYVVNYIQILYLCILKQPSFWILNKTAGCELHSNLVSLHSETTSRHTTYTDCWLWITFKSCIFAFWNNPKGFYYILIQVVNYIQILYLCILKQPEMVGLVLGAGCELHSNLVSLHSETTILLAVTLQQLLWITFKTCIFAFWNNIKDS